MKGMTKKRDTAWEEVFAVWQGAEGSDPVWQQVAREKGFGTWEGWRRDSLTPLKPEDRTWTIFQIEDLNATVPHFLVGPYQSWQKHFEEKNVHSFADLVAMNRGWVEQNKGIRARLNHFPEPTEFIGVAVEGEDTIILIEGHHRAAAVALSVANGKPVEVKAKPTIALTTISVEEKAAFKKLLERGRGRKYSV